MVLKYIKKSTIQSWYPTIDLEGHIFIYGKLGCLDENTEIYTFNKKLQKTKLKDLPENFQVISYNFNKKKREVKNAKIIDTGLKDCYEIELENGKKVIATGEHKFFDENNQEVEVKNLKVGQQLICNPFISGNIGKTKKNKSYKIKSIKYIGKRKTYDLQVEDNDNFYLSNGILSHNSGKSVAGRTILEAYHDNRFYKVWDLYGGERHEGIYWCFPSQDKSYWEKMKAVGNFDEEAPKQYKVNLLYPYFASMLPKKLPLKTGCVTPKLFTIPLKDITVEDIKCVLGTTSDTSSYIWNEIINKATRNDTCGVLPDLTKKFGGVNTLLNKNFIVPMVREKFIMNEGSPINLDLKAEADDREAITVLCLDFVPQKFHLFVMDYVIRRLTTLAKDGKIKKKNLGFIREGATFFRADDDAVTDEKIRIFRAKLSSYMRYSRSGFNFVVDTQSPAETKSILSGADDMTILFKMTSPADKEMATELYRKEKRMRPDQIADLSFLEKGECLSENTKIKIITQQDKIENKKIKELPKTFTVLSYNFKKRKFEFCKAKKIYSGFKEGIKLSFGKKENIIASEEHRFFNKHNKTIKTKHLKIKDKIVSL